MKTPEASRLEALVPIIGVTKRYSFAKAKSDAGAGLTVALFAVPQAMAFALIAGFPPTSGIYTAIVASIVAPLFGSSEFLINGPTNAIAVMLASNVALLASQGDPQRLIVLLTLMIGLVQLLGAALRAGNLTRFVSEPVLVGFTAGAGIYIAVNQLPSALGLEHSQIAPTIAGWKPLHNVVFDLVRDLTSVAQANWVAALVTLSTVVLVRLLQHFEKARDRRLPTTFLTVVLVSAATYLLGLGTASGPLKIELVQDIQPITRSLPHLVLPDLNLDNVLNLLGPAFAVALLGAVESVAIAKALAVRRSQKFVANRQLVGEGAANIAAALVGGFASSGSFTRSAMNFEAGAETRWSSIMSGLFVLMLVLVFGPLANFIPIGVLAGLLIHVGTRLMNMAKMKYVFQSTNADRTVMLLTFAGVLLFPHLEQALFVGVGTSLVLALRRAESFKLRLYDESSDGHLVEVPMSSLANREVVTLDLQGELFFATAESLGQRLKDILYTGHPFIVLRLQQAYNMDITCADALIQVSQEARRLGGRLLLSGVRTGTHATLQRAGVIAEIGEDAVFIAEPTLLGSTNKALSYARELAAGSHLRLRREM
jgi:SulP family sulfate permease